MRGGNAWATRVPAQLVRPPRILTEHFCFLWKRGSKPPTERQLLAAVAEGTGEHLGQRPRHSLARPLSSTCADRLLSPGGPA